MLWLYVGFVAFILALLALDLGVFHRKAHVVGFREAAAWSAVWVVVAMGVGSVLYFWSSARFAADVNSGRNDGGEPTFAGRGACEDARRGSPAPSPAPPSSAPASMSDTVL